VTQTPGSWLLGQTDVWTLIVETESLHQIVITCNNKANAQEMMNQFLSAMKKGPDATKETLREIVEIKLIPAGIHDSPIVKIIGVFRQRCLYEKIKMKGMSYESQVPPR
jgi:hypothetical protein